MGQVAIGIDVGGTKIAGGVVNARGDILYSHTVATPGEFPDLRREFLRLAGHLLAEAVDASDTKADDGGSGVARETAHKVVGIGVAVPGIVHRGQGIAVGACNLPWRDFPIRRLLADNYGVAAKVENDADAAALGVLRHAPEAEGLHSFVFMTVGTGIGGGIILNGLLHGGPWPLAGEIGHMIVAPDGPACNCGSHGCLEALASGTAIGRDATLRVQTEQRGALWGVHQRNGRVTAADVIAAATAGDTLAQGVLDSAGRHLAVGIMNIHRLLSPQAILIGGGVVSNSEALLDAARRALPTLHPTIRPRIIRVAGGSISGVRGAAAIAWEETLRGPKHP